MLLGCVLLAVGCGRPSAPETEGPLPGAPPIEHLLGAPAGSYFRDLKETGDDVHPLGLLDTAARAAQVYCDDCEEMFERQLTQAGFEVGYAES